MDLCILDKVAVKKRMETVMARLICSGADHVIVSVTVSDADGSGKRSASKLLLPQEVGKENAVDLLIDRLECAAISFERGT
jgi:hypothetical protein